MNLWGWNRKKSEPVEAPEGFEKIRLRDVKPDMLITNVVGGDLLRVISVSFSDYNHAVNIRGVLPFLVSWPMGRFGSTCDYNGRFDGDGAYDMILYRKVEG